MYPPHVWLFDRFFVEQWGTRLNIGRHKISWSSVLLLLVQEALIFLAGKKNSCCAKVLQIVIISTSPGEEAVPSRGHLESSRFT